MAKRRRRRSRAKRKRPSLVLIVAVLVLAAGFITRRVLAPRAMHFLTHRSAATLPPATTDNGASERLTDSDRRALDQLVRQKSGR
jgi:p-aminobenzoyl-glutamate transporter AbgT